MNKRDQQRPDSIGPWAAVLVAVVVVAAGLAIAFLVTSGSGSDSPASHGRTISPQTAATPAGGASLPEFVRAATARVQEAYAFAADRPDVMVWIPCYCGCGGHSGHLSARNCFVKESSTPAQMEYDEHGAGCEMCVSIALDAKAMSEEGRSLREIRDYIDETYGYIGPGTNTPMPPA